MFKQVSAYKDDVSNYQVLKGGDDEMGGSTSSGIRNPVAAVFGGNRGGAMSSTPIGGGNDADASFPLLPVGAEGSPEEEESRAREPTNREPTNPQVWLGCER